MSKKNRNRSATQQKAVAPKAGTPLPASPEGEEGGAGGKGFVILLVSLAFIGTGYFFLNKTDPPGKNIYACLSPVFLLAGYLLIPWALMRDK